jgi:hypothetical protein
MKRLAPHRNWILALSAAFVLMAGSNPLLRYMQDKMTLKQTERAEEQQRLAQNLQQLRDDAATAQKLSEAMDTSVVETMLAPVDRIQITARLETLARGARLSSFTYTLSPEQPFKPDGEEIEPDGIMQSDLTLQADAPQDGNVFRFIENLQQALPGRARLQRLSVERINANDKTPLATANVRMNAALHWLANGSRKTEVR